MYKFSHTRTLTTHEVAWLADLRRYPISSQGADPEYLLQPTAMAIARIPVPIASSIPTYTHICIYLYIYTNSCYLAVHILSTTRISEYLVPCTLHAPVSLVGCIVIRTVPPDSPKLFLHTHDDKPLSRNSHNSLTYCVLYSRLTRSPAPTNPRLR